MSSNSNWHDEDDDDDGVRAARCYADGEVTFHHGCGKLFTIDQEPFLLGERMNELIRENGDGKIVAVDGTWYCSREAHHEGQHEAWEEHEWVESVEDHNIAITWGPWPVPVIVEVL